MWQNTLSDIVRYLNVYKLYVKFQVVTKSQNWEIEDCQYINKQDSWIYTDLINWLTWS
jgi:hypothetical protein